MESLKFHSHKQSKRHKHFLHDIVGSRLNGFNVEIVEYKNISFTIWDVGSQEKEFNFPTLPLPLGFDKLFNVFMDQRPVSSSNNLYHELATAFPCLPSASGIGEHTIG